MVASSMHQEGLMKRVFLVGVLGTSILFASAQFAAAGTTPSPGCKGVSNAQANGNRSAKGEAALAAVAEKLGCTTTPPADPLACPAGQQTLSQWTWNPSAPSTGPTTQFTNDTPATSPYPAYGDPGGFYIEGSPTPLSVVLRSTTGEIVTVTYGPGQQVATGQAVSQNWFANRTGIQTVRFCGA
jgi:hypothetical protein